MALAPDDRYASPRALAEDIERWLGDEPVSAYRAPWSERAARWVRHHRTAAIAATLVLVTALVGLAFGTLLLQRANARTENQRLAAVENYELAQRNFEKALDTVDQYLTTVSENRLLYEPGLQPLRLELLQHALEYYEEFAASHGDDFGLRAHLAHANLRIARITADIESESKARPFFEKAILIYQQLLENHPDEREPPRRSISRRAGRRLSRPEHTGTATRKSGGCDRGSESSCRHRDSTR
jgi:serine/threonine-protein kinase